jgi:endogenous inhibitor of DNA gyrase (YacG/DUF329 family)
MNKASCPICDKPMDSQGPKDWPEWPFCSRRCRLIDLGRWLGGSYRIESPARVEDEDDADAQARPPKPAAPSAVPDRDEA